MLFSFQEAKASTPCSSTKACLAIRCVCAGIAASWVDGNRHAPARKYVSASMTVSRFIYTQVLQKSSPVRYNITAKERLFSAIYTVHASIICQNQLCSINTYNIHHAIRTNNLSNIVSRYFIRIYVMLERASVLQYTLLLYCRLYLLLV